ncbi:pyroglutamyl-peptidase I [Lachnospiraceae bacterium 62-26]|jgi:pyroglutamyl-peptidase|nr:pyroglutamyl-peptidase I [Dorea sp.]GFI50917.1 pyrrolidone-carboxylate peptidase [Lachnospiraceae bacterium]
MKVLVTGFDPFGGEAVNPAFEAVKLLPCEIAGAEIIKLEIPTVFSKCGPAVEAGIQKYEPDIVINVGQAGGRSCVTIEQVAVNLAEARIPDNDGEQPSGEPVQKDGAPAYYPTIPVKAIVKNVRDHGIPCHISYTAGTYVCNCIMYNVLHMAATKYSNIRAGFIHVPFAAQQAVGKPNGTPFMSLEMIADSLKYAIEAAVKNEKDITGIMGETH